VILYENCRFLTLETLCMSDFEKLDAFALIPVAIANPRKVKGFAIALGKAKTDKLDAQVIAQFAQAVQPQSQYCSVKERGEIIFAC